MNNKILISVLMPAYNAEKYIGEAIESILRQTYKNFELIIADDASTDETWQVIQDYLKKDKRIKAFKNKKNLYIAGNRNRLISLAKGKYIAWQDADDISMRHRLEEQVEYMEKYPKVGILGGFLKIIDGKGTTKYVRTYAAEDNLLRKKIFRYSPVAQPTAMIRRKIFNEIGAYSLRYPPAEDIDVSFRIGLTYKFANLQKVTVKYREYEDSQTFRKLRKIELSTMEIRKIYSEKGYKMSAADKIYNFLQFLAIYLVPQRLKVKLFNFLRQNKII